MKRWRIWKNLLVICFAWVLLFTAFQGLSLSMSAPCVTVPCRRYFQFTVEFERRRQRGNEFDGYHLRIPHLLVSITTASDGESATVLDILLDFSCCSLDEYLRHEVDDCHLSIWLSGLHRCQSVWATSVDVSGLGLSRPVRSTAVDVGECLYHPDRYAQCGNERPKVRHGRDALLWHLLRDLSNESVANESKGMHSARFSSLSQVRFGAI